MNEQESVNDSEQNNNCIIAETKTIKKKHKQKHSSQNEHSPHELYSGSSLDTIT